MKNVILLLSMLLFIACGSEKAEQNESEDKKSESETQVETKTKTPDKSEPETAVTVDNACDEFLDDYEAWADQVVELYTKMKEEPNNPEYAQKMIKVSEEIGQWSERWLSLKDCRDDEDYNKRMEEIKEKVENAMNE